MTEILAQLQTGDHAAFFFKMNSERLSIAIPYIIEGLSNGERCMYIADDNSVPSIYRSLRELIPRDGLMQQNTSRTSR